VVQRESQLDQVIPVSALLGYLNFSDGRPDPRWEKQLNEAHAWLAAHGANQPWEDLLAWLRAGLARLKGSSAAFRDVTQAEQVLNAVSQTLAAYRRCHADLLAHLSDAELFLPFFLARVCEAVLAQRARQGEAGADINAIVARLNDFVGYRPIAILETRPQGEPYEHERHRPVPVFLRGAGVSWGRYHDVVSRALSILKDTSPQLLAEAQFDLQLLDELAVDVRAYDHAHPVNRRPNYVFGEWDPHHLDNNGRYRRYVARKITIDALLERINHAEPGTPEERLLEAAAVLAGTILMAVGVSGNGPGAHDSSVSLSTLLPRIARYRDAFYDELLPRLSTNHAARLREEQALSRQPFGGARQHLNNYLGRHRALQLQQRYLSVLFAAMGYPEASRVEAERIPSVSGRLLSAILGRLTSGQLEVEHGRLADAARRLPEIEDLLHRGIACGAFADPWNILGFQGLFPLSAAREDSLRDPRLDELVQVIEQIFNLYARLISEAAAQGEKPLIEHLQDDLDRLTAWWDQFATSDVSDIRRVHGGETAASIRHVSEALLSWHVRGEGPADIAFWRTHLAGFRSPRAFALVVDTLLRKGDYRAAMALMTSWIAQVEQVPLEDGVASYHTLALRWMLALTQSDDLNPEPPQSPAGTPGEGARPTLDQRRELVLKFFDYLEANAEDYWQAPILDVDETDDEEPAGKDLYGAAYEEFTYQDSTDDDQESSVDDGGPTQDFDLEEEADRLEKRLRFLSTLARLWQIAARFLRAKARQPQTTADPTNDHDVLTDWLTTAQERSAKLLVLLDDVHLHPLPEPTGDYDSLVEYDRHRLLKERLLFTTISSCLDMSLAVSALQGALAASSTSASQISAEENTGWQPLVIELERHLFEGEPEGVRSALGLFSERFQSEPLLFTPLAEGGQPRLILRVRVAQTVLRALLANLPRLGLLRETYDLLKTARAMEQSQPPAAPRSANPPSASATRGRGVTEFNHFFQAAYQAVMECVIKSAASWDRDDAQDDRLVLVLERLTAPFLTLWIDHSRTLQLSVLETVQGETEWRRLQEFIERYGNELFHARFMTLANLRGILHRGVGPYLDYLRDNPDPLHPIPLLDDLDREGKSGGVRRADAIRWLELVLHAVVENYEEYKDYKTTTTQSDYGEKLYVLLEFLRLKSSYERHAWQFRPLILVHDVLARQGRGSAAVLWEESLAQLTRDLAQQHLDHLTRLERARGVRLSTIADRLNERFIKPLALDRLCALIEASMLSAQRGEEVHAASPFARMQQEIEAYSTTPMGVGLDVPHWLRRMEMEVNRVQATQTTVALLAEHFFRIPRRALSHAELQQQLREWERPPLPQ
jgi:hypothetical protein